MTERPKCFLSYAHADQGFVRREIVPILSDLGLDVWVDYEQIPWGEFIADAIVKGIRDANIVIAVLNRRSTYVNFEVGAALGQVKPTLAIIRDEFMPSDLKNLSYLRWLDSKDQRFPHQLRRAIEIIKDNPIDGSVFKAAETDRVIGISVGTNSCDIEQQFRFTVDVLALIQKISGSKDLRLVQTRKGSFSSFFTLDFKPWAELIEKVLFFIPEWKKRKAQNLKIHSEIRKIKAETNQLNTNTEIAERRAKIEHAGAMLELVDKAQALGVKIQFGEEILISIDEKGVIDVDKPERLD